MKPSFENRDSWARVKSLLSQALDRPPEERRAWIERACRESRVREEVLSLLESHERSDDFMEPIGLRPAALDRVAIPESLIGRRVGPYLLQQLIGSGGMGSVYRAERADRAFTKTVAVKLIKRGMDTDEILARFQRERQTLANLDHPHIARLLDGGSTEDGLPYLVMELVEGEPIDRYCEARHLSIDRRLELFMKVCAAVQHAHQNLIVHRDLKPGNILVTPSGDPKLLDFGIAKVLHSEAEELTGAHAGLMTLDYASPEQVRGDVVSTATDGYSLGVILYELLTGRRPFVAGDASADRMAHDIGEQEPPRPSVASGNRRLAGDLDNIVLMALRQERQRRYQSAQQLSDDLGRHRKGLPVSARPDTVRYRVAKFLRRHRFSVLAGILLLLSLGAGVVGIWMQSRVAQDERDRAFASALEADSVSHFLRDMLASVDPQNQGRDVTVREVLDAAAERVPAIAPRPEVEATVRTTIGLSYLGLGLYDQAAPHLQGALDIRRRLFAPNHPDVIESLENYGSLLYAKGQPATAQKILREAVAAARGNPGVPPTTLALGLNNLAACLRASGDLAAAEPLYHEALSIYRQTDGQHEELAQTLNNLAGLLLAKRDPGSAEPFLRESVELRRRWLGVKHPHYAQSLNNLAVFLQEKGDVEAARQLFEESLERYREILGDEHPEVAGTLKNLALCHATRNEWEVAEPLLRECLEIRETALPEDDWRTADAAVLLGRALLMQGQLEKAEPFLTDGHAKLESALGADDPRSREAVDTLVLLYERWGKKAEAARYRALRR
jgi:serine/threonine-protein kinase